MLAEFDSQHATQVKSKLEHVSTKQEWLNALEPLVWMSVSVNPESRVKLECLRHKVHVQESVPQRFLVRIQNLAGITAPLHLTPIDLSSEPPQEATWCTIKVVDSTDTSEFLSGAETEFKVVEIQTHANGLREIRIAGDAGQGTQDLGFRATADVLLDISSKENQ